MKYWFYPLFFLIVACNDGHQEVSNDSNSFDTTTATSELPIRKLKNASWRGTLNGKIPIFLHYSLEDNVVIGDITYLNTRSQQPIRLLGTIDNDNSVRSTCTYM